MTLLDPVLAVQKIYRCTLQRSYFSLRDYSWGTIARFLSQCSSLPDLHQRRCHGTARSLVSGWLCNACCCRHKESSLGKKTKNGLIFWQLGLWRIWFCSISRSARCYPTAHEANLTYFSMITSSLSQLTWTSRQTWSLDNHLKDLRKSWIHGAWGFLRMDSLLSCQWTNTKSLCTYSEKVYAEHLSKLTPLLARWTCFTYPAMQEFTSRSSPTR